MTKPNSLRIGLIGAGRMGQLYARIVNESGRGQIVALVGNRPEKTAAAASRFDVAGYPNGNIAALWENHSLDAVIVATPEWEHLQPSLESLQRGLPLLLEKPMTNRLDEAERIFQAAQGHLVMLCHVLRFDPRFAILRERVQHGELGQVKHIYTRRSTDRATYQRIDGHCHPAYWLSPHDVDLMRWITGAEVVRVQAHLAEGVFADLWLSDGTVGRFENTWSAPATLNGVWRWGLFDLEASAGRAEITPSEQGFTLFHGDGRLESPDSVGHPELHGRITGAFAALVNHFLAVVGGDESPIMTAADGLATVRVAAAIERSILENRPVDLSEFA